MRQIVEEEDEQNIRGDDNYGEDGLTVGRYDFIFYE